MFIKKLFSGKSKGFTLVEIIVVLVILAILAAATIPSMLGFVNDAKQKSLTSEVRAVYTAAQAYVTEHYAQGESNAKIKEAIEGEIASHDLYYLLQNDATGTLSGLSIDNGKVMSFSYVKGNIQANYDHELGINFVSPGYSTVPSESTVVSTEPSAMVSPSVEPSPSPSPVVKNATFNTGSNVNVKMKKLAGASGDVTSETEDNNIQGFLKATAEQFSNSGLDTENIEDSSNNVFSAAGANSKIYAWYANNNIYYYTDADNIYLNSPYRLFQGCKALDNISGLRNLDTSNATNLDCIFYGCSALTSLGELSNWDVSHVSSMHSAFNGCSALTSLGGLSNWNVPGVTSMMYMFQDCNSLTSLDGLSNWDVSNVGNMAYMFKDCSRLSSISELSNWKVSSVTAMYYMFAGCSNLTSATTINGWGSYLTGRTVDKSGMFASSGITSGNRPSWY